MIIAITGEMCAGKSTIARLLAKHYGLPYYAIGEMRRQAALEHGLTIEELNKRGEVGDTDTIFDTYQRRLGERENAFVLDSRLGKHFIPRAISIYLYADEEVRAARLLHDKEHHEKGDAVRTLEEARRLLRERQESDRRRYLRHYGIDPFDATQYDIVLDTTRLSPDEILKVLVDRIDALVGARREDGAEQKRSI